MTTQTLPQLIFEGCQDGFDGVLCDAIAVEGNRLKAILEAAKSLSIEAECVGTVHGHRELLERVGHFRAAFGQTLPQGGALP